MLYERLLLLSLAGAHLALASGDEGPLPPILTKVTASVKRFVFSKQFERLYGVNPTDLKKHEIIKLLNCKIPEARGSDISKFENVQELTFQGVGLEKIEIGAFYGLKKLRSLHIERNKLTHIQSNAFSGLRGLETLKLNHNGIEVLSDFCFAHLPKLRTLDLSGNKGFTKVSDRAFENTTNIQVLNLRGSYFSGRVPTFIRRLKNLKKIDLRDMKITGALPDFLFELRYLEEVDASHNMITRIDIGKSPHVDKLKRLDLQYNELKCLDIKFLEKLRDGIQVYFRYNPMEKGCLDKFVDFREKRPFVHVVVIVKL